MKLTTALDVDFVLLCVSLAQQEIAHPIPISEIPESWKEVSLWLQLGDDQLQHAVGHPVDLMIASG